MLMLMRRNGRTDLAGFLAMCVLTASAGYSQADPVDWDTLDPDSYIPGELLVGFKSKGKGSDKIMVAPATRNAVHAGCGTQLKMRFRTIAVDNITCPAGASLKDTAAEYLADPSVDYVEPNYKVYPTAIPNDEFWADLWGMIRIQAPDAWDTTTGSYEVSVAVIDTGMWLEHEDLTNNLWFNPGEDYLPDGTPGFNGIDDEGNGFIDDYNGWNFCDFDNDPSDVNGHGTHVSGTVGAAGNNSKGVVGVNWTIKIAAVKFLCGLGGFGSTAGGIASIEYASHPTNGFRVSNNSWGGGGFSQALSDVIDEAAARDHLVVAAAGNDGLNNDFFPHFPSSYTGDNIIAVASITSNGTLSSFSNFGDESVDIAAPGSDIISTWIGEVEGDNDEYETINGTSMACPHVAGAAALLLSVNSNLTYRQIKNAILAGVALNPELEGRVLSGGELDLTGMLTPGLIITPRDEYRVSSDPGQTNYFLPGKTYTAKNASVLTSVDLIVSNREPWIAVSGPTNVSLGPSEETNFVVTINAAVATNLPVGVYTGEVHFVKIGVTEGTETRLVLYRAYPNYTIRSTEFDWIHPISNQHLLQFPFPLVSNPVAPPFPFQFYGETYSNLFTARDGTIGGLAFNLGSQEAQDIPDGSPPDAVIAPFWDALLSHQSDSRMYLGVEGTAPDRRVVVTWSGVSHVEAVISDWTFQAIIREAAATNDNDIVFQYREVVEDNAELGSGRRATIGLEDQYGVMVRRYSVGGEQWLLNERSILFTKNPPVDTNAPTGNLFAVGNDGTDVRFEVRLDEIVTGLDTNDIVLAGNAPGMALKSVDGGGLRYFIEITNVTGLGTVCVTIPSNSFTDLSGNTNDTIGPAYYTMPYTPSDYSDDMEEDDGFWVASGEDPTEITTRGWERGAPDPGFTRGPGTAFSGTNCWGTRLGSDYTNYMYATLTSVPLNAGDHPEIHFYAFHSFEAPAFNSDTDFGVVEVNAGGGWANVTQTRAYRGKSGGWSKQVIPLDNDRFGNREIRIRFRAVSDFALVDGGIYIDDFSLVSRRPAGVWVTSVTPSNAPAGGSPNLSFTAYNSTTVDVHNVTGSVSSADSGVSVTAPGTTTYGTIERGGESNALTTVGLTLGAAGEFSSEDVTLVHAVSAPSGPLNEQFVPFLVTGIPDTVGTNVLTALTVLGVTDWLGEFIRGDGSLTSSLFQVIYAGPDGTPDPPEANGSVTDDDQLLVTLAEGNTFGRFGEGNAVLPNSGKFVKSFRHSLASGDVVYVRAWEKSSFLSSLAYGDSADQALSALATDTNEFPAWVVGTPTDATRDTNGDGVPDAYYITNGMDPRAAGAAAADWHPEPESASYASLSFPGRVVAWSNYVYIADTRNNRIVVCDLMLGSTIQTFGSFGTGDGQFDWPEGLQFDEATGHLIVADSKNDRIVVLDVASATGVVSFNFAFGTRGTATGEFNSPHGVASDSLGNIYVADRDNHRIQKFSKIGVFLVSTGTFGTGTNGFFRRPHGLTVGSTGLVYVADTENNRLQVLNADLTYVNTNGAAGNGDGQFNLPTGIRVGAGERLYVADRSNNRIQILSSAFAHMGTYKPPNGEVGSGPDQLRIPQGLFPMPDDDQHIVYVADTWNHRVQRMKLILDADSDGMDDIWEDLNGLDSTVDDSMGDLDSDGVTNIGEYRFGTDPGTFDTFPFSTGEDAAFSMRSIDPGASTDQHTGEESAETLSLTWDAVDGGIYEIQFCTDLRAGDWQAGELVYADQEGLLTVTVSVPHEGCFYRVRWLNAE